MASIKSILWDIKGTLRELRLNSDEQRNQNQMIIELLSQISQGITTANALADEEYEKKQRWSTEYRKLLADHSSILSNWTKGMGETQGELAKLVSERINDRKPMGGGTDGQKYKNEAHHWQVAISQALGHANNLSQAECIRLIGELMRQNRQIRDALN